LQDFKISSTMAEDTSDVFFCRSLLCKGQTSMLMGSVEFQYNKT